MIEEALAQFLLRDLGVTKIAGQRVYPQKVPQEEKFPRVTIARVATEGTRSNTGSGPLKKTAIRFDCWSLVELTAKQLRHAVGQATGGIAGGPILDGFRGTMRGPKNEFQVQGIFLDDEADIVLQPEAGSGETIYQSTAMFAVWYEEHVTVAAGAGS